MRRLCSLLAVVLLASASPASAQSVVGKDVARKLFEEGVELERKGDYPGALARFDQAAKIVVTPGLRFHQGYAHEMQNKLATALDDYEAALRLAHEQGKSEVEKATAARLEPLRARVPQLAIRMITQADAKVRLDDRELPQPLLDGRPFRLDPGEHAVTASASGYQPFARRFQAREGQTSTVDVILDKGSAAAPAPAPAAPGHVTPTTPPPAAPGATKPEEPHAVGSDTEPPKEEARARSPVVPIALTAGAVVLAATGVVTFLVAGGAQSDAQAACPAKVDCEDERSKVRTFDAISLVSFVGAAGLGATAIVLLASGPSTSSASPSVSARFVAGPGSALLQGAFW
jgi:hypothetical protein